MVNERISDWITEGLKKGYTKEQLKKKLIEKGYSEDEIDKAVSKPGKNIIIISVVVIVVIAAIFAYLQIKNAGPLASLQKEFEECNKTIDLQCMALSEEGSGLLENYSSIYYLGKAARTNDTIWCDKITDKGPREFCIAYLNDNASYCNNADISECIVLISAKKNSSLCESIVSNYLRHSCLALSTQNYDYCKSTNEACYAVFAGKYFLKFNDDKYCEGIKDSRYKTCCFALKKTDTANCINNLFFYSCISSLNNTACKGVE